MPLKESLFLFFKSKTSLLKTLTQLCCVCVVSSICFELYVAGMAVWRKNKFIWDVSGMVAMAEKMNRIYTRDRKSEKHTGINRMMPEYSITTNHPFRGLIKLSFGFETRKVRLVIEKTPDIICEELCGRKEFLKISKKINDIPLADTHCKRWNEIVFRFE